MKFLSKCPACNGELKIRSLQCTDCGLELRNEFEVSAFDQLSDEEMSFLMCFLRNRGNLSTLQDEMQLSYPAAKKRLSALLVKLGVASSEENDAHGKAITVDTWVTDAQSTKASEIIKTKLKDVGGRVIVHSLNGKPYELIAEADGKHFSSEAIPISPLYTYDVFDVVVDLLLSQGGKAQKGNGRNYRLGESDCDDTTVVGAIGKRYSGKEDGDSVFDPVFFLAAVMEWAGLVHNERGYITLTADYRAKL